MAGHLPGTQQHLPRLDQMPLQKGLGEPPVLALPQALFQILDEFFFVSPAKPTELIFLSGLKRVIHFLPAFFEIEIGLFRQGEAGCGEAIQMLQQGQSHVLPVIGQLLDVLAQRGIPDFGGQLPIDPEGDAVPDIEAIE